MTVMRSKDTHPLLRSLIELAPSLRHLIPSDIGITITDRNTQLLYLPGRTGRLEITPGDPLPLDSVSMISMLEERLVVKKMDRRLGHDYVAERFPLRTKEGVIIGSLGKPVEVVTHQSMLKGMVIGRSPALVEPPRSGRQAARYDVSVLILGTWEPARSFSPV